MRPKLKELDAGILRAEVATRLVTGTDITSAWKVILRRLHPNLDFTAAKASAENPHESWRHRLRGQVTHNPLATLHHEETTAVALRATFIATTVSTKVRAPLAEILTRVAGGIATRLETEAKRHAAQVGPRATARLLGMLPLAALMMASFIGVDVLRATLSGDLNTGTFVIGAVLMVVGNLWLHAMIRRTMNPGVSGLDPTLAMDIIAAYQENGVSLTVSLQAVSAASSETDLAVMARMLLLGASWEEAWPGSDGKWEQLSDVLQPAWEEGASSVPPLMRGAARARAHLTHEAVNAAEKLGVQLVVPPGVCLLPAFFALGVMPAVISTLEGLPVNWASPQICGVDRLGVRSTISKKMKERIMEKNPKNIDNVAVVMDTGQNAGQSVGKQGKLSRFLAWKLRVEEGMATAEYAIGTFTAAVFTGLLLIIMKNGKIKDAL